MAEAILECKRKVDHTSSSESEADDGAEAEKHQRQEEENARKQQELEEEQRRLKKRIERKRKRSEEAASSSSSRHHPDTIQKQFTKILEALSSMKTECSVCKKTENPKTQMDFLRAIYIKTLAIEKLIKNQQ